MENFEEQLKLKVKTLPEKPGIYQYLNAQGIIIYVGKAKNLKKRVSSYFNKRAVNGKTFILVKQIRDINYLVVDNELDALLLENNLIKKYQPKYNIQLKDDKTYPWICIKNEPFPRIFSTRNLVRDGSKYFGPYPNVKVMHTLLQLIKELYPLRNCTYDLIAPKINAKKFKVCLEYHIGNCLGPCEGKQKLSDYQKNIDQIEQLLKGNVGSVIQLLKTQMQEYANSQEFEKAHLTKQKWQNLVQYQAKSTIVSPSVHQVDVCTYLDEPDRMYLNYLSVINGAILHGYTTEIKKKLDETPDDILGFVILEMRERFQSQAKEIIFHTKPNFYLNDISFVQPKIGDKKLLVDLSLRNATYFKMEKQKQEQIVNPERHTQRILEQIKSDFRLKELPVHMECFDNSNFQGTNPVSACVVFRNGKPSKKDYRIFNVKTVVGPNDFDTMQEVVYRRYKRLLDEKQDLPQLVIIDGGKGQLGAALKALNELKLLGKIPIVGIAKKLEEIFFPGDSLPLYLDKRSESLKVIQFMRNEAHRFGIGQHRNKRSKNAIQSKLSEIEGIGEKTYLQLIQHFKTVSAVKKADIHSLSALIGKAKAQKIVNYFSKEANL